MFLIYTKNQCKFCVMAKALLTMKGQSYNEINVGEEILVEDFKEMFPEQKKLPLIFNGDDKIGGYDELKLYFDGPQLIKD